MVAIATGLWWDHSESSTALAATLTLPVDQGRVLLSGLTLLVTIAGGSFWNIFVFFLHHWKAKRPAATTFNIQIQVLLRNSAGAPRSLWDAFKLHQAWSAKRPNQLLREICTVAIPAFLIWAGFATAALFTSSVANKAYASVVARVQPQNCGFWHFNSSNNVGAAIMARMEVAETIQARSYVANFYSNGSSSTAARPIFVKPTLPFTVNDSAPCPIPATERCLLGQNKAFRVVSDFLDSHEMLGINARFEDRVSLQLSLTCSPLYTSDLATITDIDGTKLVDYFLGPIRDISTFTYRYNAAAGNNTGIGYYLRSVADLKNTTDFPWQPIPDFVRDDADISVTFLTQNDVRYFAPVYDAWFSANGTYNITVANITLMRPNFVVRAMACADQYILCNPSTSTCSSPGSFFNLAESVVSANSLNWNIAQLATAKRVMFALASAGTFNTVTNLGSGALWANSLLMGNESPGLPDNQWQAEVLGWFQTGLAKIQGRTIDFAFTDAKIGPFGSVPPENGQRLFPRSDEAQGRVWIDQCENQLVQAVGVQNFSFCGVLVIILGSAAIVLLDFSLESIVNAATRRDSTSKRARQADSKQHLLRMALTGAADKPDGWKPGKWDIPVRDGTELVSESTASGGFVSYPKFGEVKEGHQTDERASE